MEELKKEKLILEILADAYVFLTIIFFPLMVDSTGFFHIFEIKWYTYLIMASTYVGLNFIVLMYFLIAKKINYFKTIKMTIIQWLAIAFWAVNIISCFASPFFKNYNLFVGVGRGEGLIMISLYVMTFLCVSLFAKFKKKYILYFTISSILLNTIATLQYIGFNPFNMYQRGIGTHNVSFMTTIGNIDFISALYTILLSISCSAFIFFEDSKKYEKILHLISVFLGFFIIGIINVSSGKVAFLATLVIIFPFIISTNKRFSRFLVVIATILLAYCVNIIINPEYHYNIGKLGFYFQFNYIVVLFFIVIVALIFLARKLYQLDYNFAQKKKVIKNLYLSIIGLGVLGLLFLYFVDIKMGMIHEMHELLHGNFDDNFGTYRIFLWKRTIKLIPEYPLLGSGPDTFAIRFMAKYTADVAKLGPITINDTAANVYLTMIINIGIIGLTSYLAFIFAQLKSGIKKITTESSILLVAVICFIIQDFFNLWLVIVTPIFWLLLAIHYISLKNEKK